MNIGTLTGYIELEDSFTSGLDNALRSLQTAGQKAAALGANFTKLGTSLTLGVTTPLVGAAAASLSFSGTFEQTMERLVSIAGVSSDELADVRKHILDLAPAVGIGPQALAEAMTKVSSTVSDTKTALEILDIAAQGTKAGFGETVDVAGALTSVINSYGAENITAARAADILAQAVKEGGAEARELAPTLANVVPFASQLGVSFEEVAANIATMTKLGVPTAEAVTSLTSVFSALTKETDQGTAALASMGMSYAGIRDEIRDKGLAAAMLDLSAKFKGNETAMVDVFGRIEAVKNIMGTAGVQGKTLAEVLDKIKHSSDVAGGAMQNMANAMNGNQIQTWKELAATAQTIAIEFGDALAPAMGQVLEAAKPVLAAVGEMVHWFSELPKPVQTTIIAAGAVAAALGPVLVIAGQMALAWAALTPFLTSTALGFSKMIFPLKFLIDQITIFGVKTGVTTTAVWAFDMTLKKLWASMMAHPILALAAAITLITTATIKWYESTQEAELAAQEMGAKQDVINLALKRGADAGINYSDAMKYVAEWNRRAGGFAIDLESAIQNVGNKTGDTATQIRELNESVLEAGRTGKLSTPMLKQVSDALSRLGVDATSLPPALQNIIKATEQMKPAMQAATNVSADMRNALAKAQAAMVPLTKAQEDQIRAWERFGITSELAGKALGISGEAVDKYKERLALLRQEISSVYAGSVDFASLFSFATNQSGLNQIIADTDTILGNLTEFKNRFNKTAEMFPDWTQGIKGLKAALASSGLFAVETYMPMGQSIKAGFRTALVDLPKLIINSFTGGGGLSGAFNAIGATIGSELTKSIFGEAGKSGLLKGVKGLLGDVLGSVLPGIGSLLGPAISGLGKLFGKMFGTAGRDAAREFAESFGGFDALHAQLGALGDDGERLWISLTQGVGRNNADQARAAIDAVTTALEGQKTKIAEVRQAQQDLSSRMSGLVDISPAVQSALSRAFDAGNLDDFRSILVEINGVMDEEAAKTQFLEETMQKYGLSWVDLGEKARAASVATEAANMKKEMDALLEAGVDVNTVMAHMGENISDLIVDAARSGTEVPESFKPVIEAAIQSGEMFSVTTAELESMREEAEKLGKPFDETKYKITDISQIGVTFGTTMETAAQKISSAMDRLIEALDRIAPAARNAADTTEREFRSANKVLSETEYHIEGILDGHSPGGANKIPGSMERAGTAFKNFGYTAVTSVAQTSRAVASLVTDISKVKPPKWNAAAKDEKQDLERDIALLSAGDDFSRDKMRLKYQEQDEIKALKDRSKELGAALPELLKLVARKYDLEMAQLVAEHAADVEASYARGGKSSDPTSSAPRVTVTSEANMPYGQNTRSVGSLTIPVFIDGREVGRAIVPHLPDEIDRQLGRVH